MSEINLKSLKSISKYSIVCAVFTILGIAYSTTIYEISLEWSGTGVYSHGFLALLIAAYLVYQNRDAISDAEYNFTPIGLMAMFGAGFLWLAAALVNVQLIQVVSLFIIILGALTCLYGLQALWELRIALLAILLVLPVWNFLQVPLQVLSSDVTHLALKAMDIPTLREGFRFTVPGGQFLVEEACSGLSFFLSSCLLSVLFVNFNHVMGLRRLYFILFAISLSLISNWIRILVVIVVGNYTQMEHIIVQDHLTFGWVLYAVMLIPFFVVGHFATQSPAGPADPKAASGGQEGSVSPGTLTGQTMTVTLITVVVLISFPTIRILLNSEVADSRIPKAYDAALDQLTEQVSPRLAKPWNPNFAGADEINKKSVQFQDQTFRSLRVTYLTQSQGKELVYVRNSPFAKHQWTRNDTRFEEVEKNGIITKHKLMTLRDRRGTERYLATWYFIGGRVATTDREAKLYELLSRLSGDGSAHLFAFALDKSVKSDAENQFPEKLLQLSSELQSILITDGKL